MRTGTTRPVTNRRVKYRITYEKIIHSGELLEKTDSVTRIVAHNLVEATEWALANTNKNERVKRIEAQHDV